VFEVEPNSVCLVCWHREYITESAATVDNCLASSFWLGGGDTVVVLYLRCADGGYVGAGTGEGGVECGSVHALLAACASGEYAAFAAVTGHAVVAR